MTMRTSIAERVVSVLAVSVVSILLVTIGMAMYVSSATAQEASTGTQAKSKLNFSTEPSPAQKGSNTIRVKITDPAGKPITGADVTVTFFMAAMPSMNMSAMKTTITASEKDSGTYEGKGDLGSAGMWQVTINATKGGHRIATKKLTIKATGGM